MSGSLPPSDHSAVSSALRRGRRIAKWVVGSLAVFSALLLLGLLLLRVPGIGTRVAHNLLDRVPVPPGTTLSVGTVRGDWITHLELLDLRFGRDQTQLIQVASLRLEPNLWSLLRGRVDMKRVDVAGVDVSAELVESSDDEEKPASPATTTSFMTGFLRGGFYSGPSLLVRRLEIRDSHFREADESGRQVTDGALTARDLRLGDRLEGTIDSLTVHYTPPGATDPSARLRLTASLENGRLRLDDLTLTGPGSAMTARAQWSLDETDSLSVAEIDLRAHPLDLSDLGRLLPDVPAIHDWEGIVDLEVVARGPRLDRLSGSVDLEFAQARLGDLAFERSTLHARVNEGRADLDVDTRFAGAGVTVDGWVRPLDPLPRYEATLELDALPRALPGVPAWTDIAQRGAAITLLHVEGEGFTPPTLRIRGNVNDGTGQLDLEGVLRIASGVSWDLLRLQFDDFDVAGWLGHEQDSRANGTLRGEGSIGEAGSPNLTAHWELDASRWGTIEMEAFDGNATLSGTRLDASLRVQTASGGAAADTVTVRWDGEGSVDVPQLWFTDVDLSHWLQSAEMPSELTGTLRLHAVGITESTGRPLAESVAAGGRLRLEPSRFRGRAVKDGRADFDVRDGNLSLVGTFATDAGALDLRADLPRLANPDEVRIREARFTDVDVGAWAHSSFSTRLNGQLSGSLQLHPTGPIPVWSADLRLEPSQVGPVAVTAGRTTSSSTGEQLRSQGTIGLDQGDVDFEITSAWNDRGPEGEARLTLPFDLLRAVIPRDSVTAEGDAVVEIEFAGRDRETLVATARLDGRGRWGNCEVDSLLGNLRFAAGALSVEDLNLRSNVAQVSIDGRLLLDARPDAEPTDLQARVSQIDPSPLAAVLGQSRLQLETGSLDVHLTGRPPAQSLEVGAELQGVVYGNFRVGAAHAQSQVTLGENFRPMEAEAKLDVDRARAPAAHLDQATATATFDGETLRFSLATQLDEAVRSSLVGSATRDSITTHLTLSEAKLQEGGVEWNLTAPTHLSVAPGRITVDSLEMRAGAGFVTAAGTLDRDGAQDFRFQAENLGLQILARWLDRDDLTGRLDGKAEITGPAGQPRATGSVRIDAVAAGEPAGQANTRLQWDGSQLEFDTAFASPEGDSLKVAGHLPFRSFLDSPDTSSIVVLPSELDLRATADRFPLQALAWLLPPNAVSDLRGYLDADLRLRDQGEGARAEGRLAIGDAAVTLPSLRAKYDGIDVRGSVAGNQFELERARLESDQGSLDVTGRVLFSDLSRIEPDLTVSAKRFVAVDRPNLRVQLTSDLRLQGTLAEPQLKGRLTLNDCVFYLTDGAFEGSSEVELTPADLRMLEETFGDQSAPTDSLAQSLFDAADLDLDLSIARNNWLRKSSRPRLAVEVTGQVHARKPAHGKLDLRGRLSTASGRGYVEHFGRTFDVVSGEVLLNGPMDRHAGTIQTEYKVRTPGESDPEVVVHLDVRATANEIDFTLSSVPSLSETEIVSYITTGRSRELASNPSSGGSDALALAADIGLSQVTAPLEDLAQEKVGLDVFQVRYDPQLGPTLVAGRYVDPVVYIGFRQPIQYRDDKDIGSQNTYRTTAEIEVEVYRWLVVSLQGEVSLLRSFIRASHEY